MGFERLAELKEQLAKQAAAKSIAKPLRTRRARPVARSEPVDPAVITIGKLQKRFSIAAPKATASGGRPRWHNGFSTSVRVDLETCKYWRFSMPISGLLAVAAA